LTVRDDLGESLGLLLSATRGLPTGLDLPQRLAENAGGAGSASTRARSLLKLAQEFREHPVTRKTLEAACADPSPEVRLRAALELGEERLDLIVAIAEDAAVDDTSAASAVYALGPRLAADRAIAILETALRARRVGSAHACLQRLRSEPEPAVLALLLKVLAIERGELAVHAAQALADRRSPDVETALVAALARDADVRRAAAEALGRCGSITAVLPLKEAAERHPEADFQRAVRQAVATIQERASGASPGQLSIASAEAGQVSLADAEAGRLSLPAQKGGEVALADDRNRRDE
jgi:HEAT repeat protein